MIGGDERAALHHLLAAIAAGDWAGTHANLETLLIALGRTDAADLVRGSALAPGVLLEPSWEGVVSVERRPEFLAIV